MTVTEDQIFVMIFEILRVNSCNSWMNLLIYALRGSIFFPRPLYKPTPYHLQLNQIGP